MFNSLEIFLPQIFHYDNTMDILYPHTELCYFLLFTSMCMYTIEGNDVALEKLSLFSLDNDSKRFLSC